MELWRSRYKIGLYLVKIHGTKARFLLVGALNTAVGLCVFPLLFFLIRPEKTQYLYILAISYLICILFSFITNKSLVFRTTGNYTTEFRKFLIFHLFNFLLNLTFLPVLVEVVGIDPVYAQTLFTLLVVLTSYFWHSRITFKI